MDFILPPILSDYLALPFGAVIYIINRPFSAFPSVFSKP